MSMNTGRQHQHRGRTTEAVVVAALLERGFGVSVPPYGSERYDLVLDTEDELERVQVKTAYEHGETEATVVAEFQTTVYGSDGTPRRTYYDGDEIDAYLIHCPDRAVTLYVPYSAAPKTQMNFSFRDRSTYGEHNRKTVNFAAEYVIDEQL
jgi:hypothetical protein